MLEINIRRLGYSALFPKSKMAGLVHHFDMTSPEWSFMRKYAHRLYGAALNSYSLKKAVEKSPLMTMLYMKQLGKWDSIAYLSGEDPRSKIFQGLYDWLECSPAKPPRKLQSSWRMFRRKRTDPGVLELVETPEDGPFWVSYSPFNGFKRHISMVSQDYFYTHQQKHEERSGWHTLWSVRSTPEKVEIRVEPHNVHLVNLTKVCMRHWSVERSVALTCGEAYPELTTIRSEVSDQIFDKCRMQSSDTWTHIEL